MHQEVKLISKRNDVYRIFDEDKTYISKMFASFDSFHKEKEILSIMKKEGANVPDIIKSSHNVLLMEDLGEETLLNWYENLEKQNSNEYDCILLKLCAWLKKFYSITFAHYNEQFILQDVNFRNFIIKNNEIYGIDFEQSCPGNIETDAGKLTAYALTYDPYMTKWKIDFRNKFIDVLSKELNLDKNLIYNEEKNEIKSIEKRRQITFEKSDNIYINWR